MIATVRAVWAPGQTSLLPQIICLVSLLAGFCWFVKRRGWLDG